MKSDITVSEKSVWLTHHIERVEYICSICIEAKALWVSQSSFFFFYLQMMKTVAIFISVF